MHKKQRVHEQIIVLVLEWVVNCFLVAPEGCFILIRYFKIVHSCMLVRAHVHLRAHAHLRVHAHVCMLVRVCVHERVRVRVCLFESVCPYMCGISSGLFM